MLHKFDHFINENIDNDSLDKLDKTIEPVKELPDIFTHTIYRIPTDEEIADLKNYDLSGDDIMKGLGYTIIGRGILSSNNKKLILKAFKKIVDAYPENTSFAAGYEHAKTKYGDKYPINIKRLNEYANAIKIICAGEYGQVYLNEEKKSVFICLGDSNPFEDGYITEFMRGYIKETHWVQDDEFEIIVECESGPPSNDWKKIN
jgi:hypothetical protein